MRITYYRRDLHWNVHSVKSIIMCKINNCSDENFINMFRRKDLESENQLINCSTGCSSGRERERKKTKVRWKKKQALIGSHVLNRNIPMSNKRPIRTVKLAFFNSWQNKVFVYNDLSGMIDIDLKTNNNKKSNAREQRSAEK